MKAYITFLLLLITFFVHAQKNEVMYAIATSLDSVHTFKPDKTKTPTHLIHLTHTSSSKDSIPIREIKLHEVKVVAYENRTMGSSSTIGREAIQHVQPFSLSELMQLLPGGTTPKVSFQYPGYFNIRSASSPLGTGISIDGVRLSGNVDLQQQNEQFGFGEMVAQSGLDTRTLSTDNIETVEVVRGIPSVRFGDITSGMVIVHTQKRARPLTASIRITPEIKSFNASKGWLIDQKNVLNFAIDYTRANSDIGTTSNIFNRISLQTSYIAHLNSDIHPVTLEIGVDGDITTHRNPANLFLQPNEYIQSGRQSFRFRFSGNWQTKRHILKELNWKTNVEYGHSLSKYDHNQTQQTYTAATAATIEGEQEGFSLPSNYWSYGQIESQPITISTGITANFRKSGKQWKSKTSAGFEGTSEGNTGSGKSNGYHTPFRPSQNRYDFSELPFMHHYAVFLEENLQIKHFSAEGGIRFTGVFIQGMHLSPTLEPRLNLNYLLLQQPDSKHLRLLRLKGGIGLLRKLPTLGYLFKENQYHNFTNFYYHDETSDQTLAIVTTYISKLSGTQSIQLPKNLKAEFGITGLCGNFSFDLTGFYEYQKYGFGQNLIARPVSYRTYKNPNKVGQTVEYRNGEVYINGEPAGYTNDTTFITSPQVNNHLYERKGGMEFVFRSDYIPVLATTFLLDGAWIIRKTEDKSITPDYNQVFIGGQLYNMCAFFDNSNSFNVSEQLSTTLRAVTEIPVIRLTTTLALQTVWMQHSQTKIKDQPTNRFYMLDDNNNRIETDLSKDSEKTKYIDPVYYMDTQGDLHPFTPEMATDPTYKIMVKSYYSRKFLKNSFSPYFLLNLRMTKEIGKHIHLAFFANNLAKMNPKRYSASTGQYVEMNVPTIFGVELQIKI